MRKYLFRWIFKKELNQIQKNLEYQIKSIDKKSQASISEIQKSYSIAKRVFNLFPDAEIIGIEPNDHKEELYVVKRVDSSLLTIYLLGESYQAINNLPRIMASIKTDYTSKEKYIKIHDILMVDNSIGNGAIAMKHFLNTARKTEAKYISGVLSSVDSDHFNRLEKYYERFGFEVKFNDIKTSGSIKIVL